MREVEPKEPHLLRRIQRMAERWTWEESWAGWPDLYDLTTYIKCVCVDIQLFILHNSANFY